MRKSVLLPILVVGLGLNSVETVPRTGRSSFSSHRPSLPGWVASSLCCIIQNIEKDPVLGSRKVMKEEVGVGSNKTENVLSFWRKSFKAMASSDPAKKVLCGRTRSSAAAIRVDHGKNPPPHREVYRSEPLIPFEPEDLLRQMCLSEPPIHDADHRDVLHWLLPIHRFFYR